MKTDNVKCFNYLDAINLGPDNKSAPDSIEYNPEAENNDQTFCTVSLNSFALPQKDQIKLRLFSTIRGLTPDEVLTTALREYMENNGPSPMKTVFNS